MPVPSRLQKQKLNFNPSGPMRKSHSKTIWFILATAVIIALAVWGIGAYIRRPAVIKPTPINTNAGNQNGKFSASSTSSSSATTQNTGPNSPKGAAGSSGSSPSELTAPSGSFVSNHKPNLSGSPAPNTEESTCVVQQSVSCNISFTKNGVTKSLGAQTAGSNGIVAWRWSLQGLDLTQGSWTIKATATLGQQSLSTNDPILLDVQP